MDRRLLEAALMGNIDELHQLLKERPLLLHGISLSSGETPLHVAAMAGNLNFVKEIIRLNPKFTEELNQDGFSALHIASANGHLEIVRELLNTNRIHCNITGREDNTALHYAAVKGRTDVINELLKCSAESIEATTTRGETALHLAMMNHQIKAFEVMVQKLKPLDKEDVINKKDERGNTVLHLATYTKQREAIELLLIKDTISIGVLEVNAVNKSGLTALDLLVLFPSEAGDREIEWILRDGGAKRAVDLNQEATQQANDSEPVSNNSIPESSASPLDRLVDYFKFKRGRDSPEDARNALLVIAVLIAATSYQAGLSPPGGFWQDNDIQNRKTGNNTTYLAGKSILSTTDQISFGLFLYFNSVQFYLSLFMINILTFGFPLRLELQICLMAMGCTYNIAMVVMGPTGIWSVIFHTFSAVFPVATPFILSWFRRLIKKRFKWLTNVNNRLNRIFPGLS